MNDQNSGTHSYSLDLDGETIIVETGKLAGQDFSKLRQRADDSRQYLFAKAGWPLDIFAD